MDAQLEQLSTQELIKLALDDAEKDEYSEAIPVLQFRGDREVFEAAKKLCESANLEERILGAHILGQLGMPDPAFPDECSAILRGMLQRAREPDELDAVGVALGHWKDEKAIAPLIELKNHPSPKARFGVVYGLLGQEDNRAIAALMELASDPDYEVRNWATFGLGSCVDADTPALRSVLWQQWQQLTPENFEDDENHEIYGEALVGLARRKDERIVKLLLEEFSSHRVGILTLEAAGELGDTRLYPALLEVREWWSGSEYVLEGAIANCRPEKTISN
ncbi:MAG: HEAT repeat domain-containing protein [Cyanobacteriota bacterium]|nr:HEAT repeat domain-containing protein [Cyanobacteriota bacterium]